METAELNIGGMTCGGCVRSITRVLESLPGVASAEVSLEDARACVTYDPAAVNIDTLRQMITEAGYDAG
ncbi:MAG: heavy-metal-associated domain-containing protein [Burkholderiales bacterium]